MARIESTTPRVGRWPALMLGRRAGGGALAALALLAVGLWQLGAAAAWWDEGWTLSVAQNWVRLGHYGRLLNGQLAPPGLEAAFPVTASVALSFKLFGIGLWQARLVGVLFLLAALALLWALAQRLYDRAVAWATLAALVLLSAHPQLHPLLIGRQVLAELPMLTYLLAGYLGCLLALSGRGGWLLLAIVGWGVGIVSKAQALPFWLVSLLLPLLLALWQRQWRTAALLALGLAGAYGCARALLVGQALLLQGQTLPTTPLHGLVAVVAVVPYGFVRLFVLQMVLTFGLPVLLGLGYAAAQALRQLPTLTHTPAATIRLALLLFAGSWYGWYTLLSIGSLRYLFPATFVGSLFLAALLAELTGRFDLHATLRAATGLLRRQTPPRRGLAAWAAILLCAAALPLTALSIVREYGFVADTATRDVAAYLHRETPPDALIETYDSELHPLLERRYHYPPDQVHVELMRRSIQGPGVVVPYDPLAADPDYLVVGTFNRRWQLYDPVLNTGAFRQVAQFGQYAVYQRVR